MGNVAISIFPSSCLSPYTLPALQFSSRTRLDIQSHREVMHEASSSSLTSDLSHDAGLRDYEMIVRLEFVVKFSNSVWISRLIVLNIKTSETRVSPTDKKRTLIDTRFSRPLAGRY